MMASGYMLGKTHATHDRRTLQFPDYTRSVPPPPTACAHTGIDQPWGMLGNDRLSDCVIAMEAHLLMVFSAFGRGECFPVTDAEVVSAYRRVAHWRPAGPDDPGPGCNMLAAMKDWRTRGVGGGRIAAFAGIHSKDVQQIKTAIWLFGGVAMGVELPDDALPTAESIPPWGETVDHPTPTTAMVSPWWAMTPKVWTSRPGARFTARPGDSSSGVPTRRTPPCRRSGHPGNHPDLT